MSYSKIIAILFCLLLLTTLGGSLYLLGKNKAKLDCKEQEIKTKTETVEVIKYVYKDTAKIYIKPNSTFKELLDRMKNGEI